MPVHTGDIGTKITLDVGLDISQAAAVKILYKKPSGAYGAWTATKDGTSIYYITQAGDINSAGRWTFQSYISNLDGYTGYGNIVTYDIPSPMPVAV